MPSAVHLAKPANTPLVAQATPADPKTGLLDAFRRLMSTIVANSEDVGREFAEEARKIHYLEAPARSIRGEASVEEFEALREEGIEILLLPTIKKENLN